MRCFSIGRRCYFNVAIVGAGPAGFYMCGNLLKKGVSKMKVHIFERLPCPYGLIRYGVAPDHPEIRNVQNAFEGVAMDPRVSYFGNVEIGKDVGIEELKGLYNCIVLCCGAQEDRKLGIPGETLVGVYSARDFVEYYNGHPDNSHGHFDLSGEKAFIIGNGNVAIDIARIILDIDSLEKTDISHLAFSNIKKSKISHVSIFGRRGPVQGSFTTKELRTLAKNSKIKCLFDKSKYSPTDSDMQELKDRALRRKFQLLSELENSSNGFGKRIDFQFLLNPVEFLEDPNRSRHLGKVKFEVMKLGGPPFEQRAIGTKEYLTIDSQVIFKSIGYRLRPIDGIPFDCDSNTVSNTRGAVNGVNGIYTCGWFRRGANGVILTNMQDAEQVGETILEDLDNQIISTEKTLIGGDSLNPTEKIMSLLHSKNIKSISFQEWQIINQLEIERGKSMCKPREKYLDVKSMLDALSNINPIHPSCK